MATTALLKEKLEKVMQANIELSRLVGLVLLYFFVIVFVAATLYRDYVLNLGIGVFDISLDPLLYAFAIAVLGYKVQVWFSEAYGGRRFIDILVSSIMLVVVGLAVVVWTKFPIAQTIAKSITDTLGIPIETTANGYKLAVAFIFGVLALWDVLLRDLLGFGRISTARRKASTGGTNSSGFRREDYVSGAHGDLPDSTEELHSRTGSPVFRATGDAIIDLNWWVRNPITGELMPIPAENVPPRLAIRLLDHIRAHPPQIDAEPAAPATAPSAGSPPASSV